MADTDKKIRVSLIAGETTAIQAVQRLQKEQDALETKLKRANELSSKAVELGTEKAYKEAAKAVQDYERAVKRAETETQKQAQAAERAADAARRQAEEQERANRERAVIASRNAPVTRDNVGDISTISSSLGSLTGIGGVSLIGELTGIAEYLPNAADALRNMGSAALQTVGQLGPFGIAVAAVGTAVVAAGAQIASGIKEMDDAIAASITKQAEITRRIGEGLTTEQAQEQIEELNRKLIAEQEILETTLGNYNQAFEAAVDQAGGDFGGRIAFALAQGFSNAEEATQAEIATAQQNIANYTAEIEKLTAAVDGGKLAANDQAAKEKELAEEREKGKSGIDELITASQTLVEKQQQAAQAIADFNEATADLAARRNLSDSRASEDRRIAQARRAEDLERSLAEQRTAQIERVQQIQQQAAQAIIQANEAMANAIENAASASEEVETSYQRESTRRLREYLQRREDIERGYERAREDALLNQDVSGFLGAEQDFKDEKRTARRDRRDEEADALEEKDLRLAQIEEEKQAAILATQEKIAKIIEQRDADIAASEAAFQAKLAKDEELRAIQAQREQEDFELRMQRLQEDRDIEDAARQRQLDKTLANLDIEGARREVLHQSELAFAGQMQTAVARVKTGVDALIASAAKINTIKSGGGFGAPVNYSAYNSTTTQSGGGFGGGSGLVNNPYQTPSYNNPNVNSGGGFGGSNFAGFPVSPNAGRSTGGMNNQIVVNVENVGDNVNRSEVIQWIGEGVRTGMRNIVQGQAGANLDARFN